MPLYRFHCHDCGAYTDEVYTIASRPESIQCDCGGRAKRIISCSTVNCANNDAGWLRSVTDIVNPEGGPHCQEFRRNPTRENWKAWMKGEGVRPMDESPGRRKPSKSEVEAEDNRVQKGMMEALTNDSRIEVA